MAIQSIWRIDVDGPATKKALKPTVDDTRRTSYSPFFADRKEVSLKFVQ